MPSLTVIYYAGLIPAALLLMARAMWLANHDDIARPVAVVIKMSEWTHLDGWIDAYISWLERMAKRWL